MVTSLLAYAATLPRMPQLLRFLFDYEKCFSRVSTIFLNVVSADFSSWSKSVARAYVLLSQTLSRIARHFAAPSISFTRKYCSNYSTYWVHDFSDSSNSPIFFVGRHSCSNLEWNVSSLNVMSSHEWIQNIHWFIQQSAHTSSDHGKMPIISTSTQPVHCVTVVILLWKFRNSRLD